MNARIVENLPRVPGIARRVARRFSLAVDHDELIQGGVLGLIDAARRFDASRGSSFAAYSEMRIRGAVVDQLRALDWLPRSIRRSEQALERCVHAAQQRGDGEVSAQETAESMGLPAEVALRPRLEPLDEEALPSCAEEADVADPLGALCAERTRYTVDGAIRELPECEREVVSLLYWTELGLEGVARRLGMEPGRVRMLHLRALRRLRVRLRELSDS